MAALSEQITELKSALRALPEKQREAVLMRDLYGLKYGEIAAALATTRPAVEALLFRARRELRVRLRPLRDVAAGLTVPSTLRDALEVAIPGFGASGGTAGAVVAGAGLAKLGSPAAVKLVAAALAVGTAGSVGSAEVGRFNGSRPESRAVAAITFAEPRPAVAPREVVLMTRVSATKPRDDDDDDDNAADDNRGRGGGDEANEQREDPDDDRELAESSSGKGHSGSGRAAEESSGSGSSGGDVDDDETDDSDDLDDD